VFQAEGFCGFELNDAFYLTDVYGPRLTGSPNLQSAGEWDPSGRQFVVALWPQSIMTRLPLLVLIIQLAALQFPNWLSQQLPQTEFKYLYE
jgi:hypothetical protein